ncbi:MAG: universal stress protein [Pseudomonadota bacterium]
MSLHAETGQSSIGEVLVITDAAPASANAVWRGALIAREHGASMRVLHNGQTFASAALAEQAIDRIGRQVQERLGIAIHAETLGSEPIAKAIAAARSARLMVTAPRRASPLREWISGVDAERLMRLNRIPTLVVRRPATPGRHAALLGADESGRYGRVLVSVDLSPGAPDVIAAAAAFSRDPQMQVLYAVSTQAFGHTPAAQGPGADGSTVMQKAQVALRDFVNSAASPASGIVPMVAFGRTADCLLKRERAIGAELVVIGQRKRGWLAASFAGEDNRTILADSTADVLVVPQVDHLSDQALADRPLGHC